MTGARVAGVLLDSHLPQLDHLFEYAVPTPLQSIVRVGQRVRVPFRSEKRKNFGWVITLADESEYSGTLSPLADIVSEVPYLTPEVWRLVRALADRAAGNASDLLRLAIPKRHVRAERAVLAAREKSESEPGPDGAHHRDLTPGDPEQSIAARLTAGQRLALTQSHGPTRLEDGTWVSGWAARLARIATAVHAQGRSVIIAVPDYRDLDQVQRALTVDPHAPEPIRVDAKQSDEQRFRGFLRALEAAPHILIGNRSAVYAPAHQLGAILMWDDGDPLFAEPLAPYVHARDAALQRSMDSGCGLFFHAHARSTEVHRLVRLGFVSTQEHLPQRVRTRHADQAAIADAYAGRLPGIAISLMNEGLRTGPVLVQVASPGYAPVAVCSRCKELAHCETCGGPVSFRRQGAPACRWCGALARVFTCGSCGNHSLEQRGAGSTRTAEQFAVQFPNIRILVSDGDHPRERVDARPAIVVATPGAEPIAAGGYRAVVLLDAYRLLSRPTLRAGEDCLRWWENAAALAAADGVCLLASGAGPVVDAFIRGTQEAWLSEELRDRHSLRYPPMVRVASVSGTRLDAALGAIADLSEHDVLGPAPDENGVPRAIVRFSYAQGEEVARRLRAQVVTEATARNAREPLRLRFDDRGVFDQWL